MAEPLEICCPRCGSELPDADTPCARCAFQELFEFAEEPEAPADDEEPDFDSGFFLLKKELPGYRIERYVARGGMGLVYQAEHLALNRLVALKVMASGALWTSHRRERFNMEAEAVAQLEHPNIVPIYDVGRWDGRPFIALRWVEGVTLDQWLLRQSATAESGSAKHEALVRQVIAIMATVCRAVHHAHQRGFLHRDLKPGNIMVDEQGEAFVTDFGLARRLDDGNAITLSGEVLGTPSFMSPEQARGDIQALSVASDVFSLGAILYWVLTGQAPFAGASTGEILKKIETEDPRAPSTIRRVHVDLETVAMKCLRKETSARYASAEELAEDLDRWLRGEPVHARRLSAMERLLGFCLRKPMVAALTAWSGLLLIVFVVQLTVSNQRFRVLAEEEASLRREAQISEGRANDARGEAERARESAQESAQRLADHVLRLRMEKAQGLLATGRVDAGVASLAALVRDYPEATVVQRRLIGALKHRNPRLSRWVFDLPENQIRGAAISPDGRRLVVARIRGVLEVFDVETGRSLARHERAETFFADLTFGPRGEWLIALSYGRIRGAPQGARDRDSFKARIVILQAGDLSEVMAPIETEGVGAVARVSPDRTRLAAQVSGTKLWTIPEGRLLMDRRDNRSGNHLKWSPDSAKFATLSRYQTGLVFDRDGKQTREIKIGSRAKAGNQLDLTGQGLRFRHVDRLGWAYAANRTEYVTTIGPGGTLEFWRSDSGTRFASAISRGEILCFDLHDGLIVTGERNGEITRRRMGLLNRTRPLAALGGPIVELDFSDDGTLLLASTGERTGGVAELIDPGSGRILGAGFRWHGLLARNRPLTRAATLLDSQKVGVFDLSRHSAVRKERFLEEKTAVTDLIVSPGDDRLAVFAGAPPANSLWLFDLPFNGPGTEFAAAKKVVFHPGSNDALIIKRRAAVRLDARGVATQLDDGEGELRGYAASPETFVRVRRGAHRHVELIVGEQVIREHRGGRGELWTAVDHRRDRLWTVDGEGAVEEIDLTSHETLRRHQVDLGGWIPVGVGLSPGGHWLFVQTAQAGLLVLSVGGDGLVSAPWKSDEPIARHAFASGDGQLALISTAGDAYVLTLRDAAEPTQVALSGEAFVDICFTRDDSVVVTANRGGRIEFFDTVTGLPVWEPVEMDASVNCLAASSDGGLVWVGTESGAWKIPLGWTDPAANAVDWLPDFAEALVRMKLTERGRFYELTWEETRASLGRAQASSGAALPNWAKEIAPQP